MRDILQYTPEQLIAECQAVKTACVSSIVDDEKAISDNNIGIENLLRGINDINAELARLRGINSQKSADITNLYARIDMEDWIITHYLTS